MAKAPSKSGKRPDGRDVLVEMGRKGGKGGASGKGGKGKPRGAGGSGGGRTFFQALGAWTKCVVVSSVVGAALGGGLVLGGMYRHALSVVEASLEGHVWSVPGRVLSGPMEVSPGLTMTPDELAEDLRRAGYAKVARPQVAGDFSVGAAAVVVKNPAIRVPGTTHEAGTVTVSFAEGRVSRVTGGAVAVFNPVQLASIRGPDNESRSPVPLERIPQDVRRAVMAMEDARFYEHPGVDALGVARAIWVNLVAREMSQGGSSLTQQLAKNLFLTPERTASRKIQEALMAFALEKKLSKDEILSLYLNEVYLGQANGSSVCGVDAAARAYFGKPVERLTLGEAATLGGIISSPNPYSPLRHPDKAQERRDLALTRMVTMGWATADEAARAKKSTLKVNPPRGGRIAPWAVDAVVERVEDTVGEGSIARDSMVVYTSIQPALQRLAERAVAEGLAEVVGAHPKLVDVEAALAVVRVQDGAIVALVGGKDAEAGGFDRASLARRQVGSTVKALTTLAAFEEDPALSPAYILDDSPLTRTHDGKEWSPKNYDGAFQGPMPLRRAIAQSRNIPAVLLAEKVGRTTLRDRLQAVGIKGATDYPSAALGGFEATPVELAGAYAVLGGKGYHAPWLLRATVKGDTYVIDAPPEKATVKYSPRATWLTWSVLREVLDTGTGKSAAKYGVGPGAIGKSGTTDNAVDAWFAGVSGPYAVVAWVGHDKNQPVGLTGGQAALPIWARFVASTGADRTPVAPPDSVVEATVCVATGLPPCEDCAETGTEWFPVGAVPEPDCDGDGARDVGTRGADAPGAVEPPRARGKDGRGGNALPPGQGKKDGWEKLGDWLFGR